jgi:hypothetical protein
MFLPATRALSSFSWPGGALNSRLLHVPEIQNSSSLHRLPDIRASPGAAMVANQVAVLVTSYAKHLKKHAALLMPLRSV